MRNFTQFILLAFAVLLLNACQNESNLLTEEIADRQELEQAIPEDAPDFVKELATYFYQSEEFQIQGRGNELSVYRYLQFKPELSIFLEAVERIPGLIFLLDNYLLPATVFVPTNEAFEKFFDENGFSSIDEVPYIDLVRVVSNHILLGKNDIEWLDEYMGTLAYADCFVRGKLEFFVDVLDPNNAIINGYVNVVQGNQFVGSGFVHWVDMVIAPSRILEFIENDDTYSILAEALNCTGFSVDFNEVLSQAGPFTFFAPTNEAFEKLLSQLGLSSICEVSAPMLEMILLYHVKPGANITFSMLARGKHLHTLVDGLGYETVLQEDKTVKIIANANTATIVQPDLQSNNGVVHGIDAVLMP